MTIRVSHRELFAAGVLVAALLIGLAFSCGDGRPDVGLVTVNPGVDSLPGPTTVLIPINEAGAEELQLLPGIGAKRAADIIKFREANGPFLHVDSLQLVRGIGPVTVERIRPFVRVDD